ncbi:MAG: 50S ribosomal protein L4 [Clostridiales bacterium]|nr:50S ribosomal protein L4 [Clostridiales bacterium]
MPKVNLYNMNGEVIDQIALADEIFGLEEINDTVIHTVVKMQLANKRQGTQSALTRAEVSGGGKKPYRQKGSGRARHGSTRSPIWTKGGVVFAPKPRDYSYTVPKKVRRLALKNMFTAKVREDNIRVIDEIAFEEIKTKKMAEMFKKFGVEGRKIMLLINSYDENIVKSARNIDGLKVSFVGNINVLDMTNYDMLITSKGAVAQIEEVYR